MNWQQIKEQHPKAWAAFYDHSGLDMKIDGYRCIEETLIIDDGSEEGIPFNTRDLYDFFDSKGIEINAGPIRSWSALIFHYYILHGEDRQMFDNAEDFPTRTEAESQAFTRAFQILEERLAA